jgi:hypothetical protein
VPEGAGFPGRHINRTQASGRATGRNREAHRELPLQHATDVARAIKALTLIDQSN